MIRCDKLITMLLQAGGERYETVLFYGCNGIIFRQ